MKRYSPDRDGAMDEYDDGEWVKYEHAAELQRQLDAARSILALADTRINAQVDALLREREQYKAACALAEALRKKGSGS